jgi:hypothetical protein
MATNKEPYILLTIYMALYEQRYGKKPRINKYKEKWAMQDVLDSLGSFDQAKDVLNYYFRTGKNGHPLNFFYNNFDRLEDMMIQINKDVANRARLLEQTRKLVEEE